MFTDLSTLNIEQASYQLTRLLEQLTEARLIIENGQRRAAGIVKMAEGLVELFPSLEDLLPEDLNADEPPRPRGAAAVLRTLISDAEGQWLTVGEVVGLLNRRDWLPQSSNPNNAVRTALERLVESKKIEKARSQGDNAVIYRFQPPKGDANYDQYGEEPF